LVLAKYSSEDNIFSLLQPDLMPSFGVILSEFPDEPYLAKN